jgi:hypothetical protein
MSASAGLSPIAMDPFSRFMVAAFKESEIIGVPTGFLAFFGNPAGQGRTLFSPNSGIVDIDIQRGNEKTAALIPRGTVSRPLGSTQKNMRTPRWTSQSRKYPLSEEEGDISADELNFRVAGENPYAGIDRAARLRILALDIFTEGVRRSVRMMERLAAISMLTGKMPAIFDTTNSDLEYDFKRRATHNISVSNPWDGGSADIQGDLTLACDRIRADGHVMPDSVFLGKDAVAALINDADMQAKADNRRYELIQVSTNNPVPEKFNRFVESGWIPRGRLRLDSGYELWMFTYLDVYTDEADAPQFYMPVDEAIVTSVNSRFDRYFGPPELLPPTSAKRAMYSELFGFDASMPNIPINIKGSGSIIMPEMFYGDAYLRPDGKGVTVREQCAPIFATTMTDAIVKLDSLIT